MKARATLRVWWARRWPTRTGAASRSCRRAVTSSPTFADIPNSTTSAEESQRARCEECRNRRHSCDHGSPRQVDEGNRHRPAAQRGQVRDVVSGIDDETEQRAMERGREPRSGQGRGERGDTDGENEIEQDCNRPNRAIEQEMAEPRLVEVPADDSQPQ